MNTTIEKAILLRRKGRYADSRLLLEDLLNDQNSSSLAHLHIAWSYDNEGLEQQAVAHYEASLSGNLSKSDQYEAIFGLASTLRSLGRYEEAMASFEKLLVEFPGKKSFLPFYAMCLYNLGECKKSVELLLTLLADTTEAKEILDYEKAIRLYAVNLDRKW